MTRTKVGTVTAKDCVWTYFRAGGKGGQSQNKTDSACRVVHEPSGAVGESREHKSQLQNRRAAWTRMAESDEFRKWVRVEVAMDALAKEELGRRVQRAVERTMQPKNLKVEIIEDGEWTEVCSCGHPYGMHDAMGDCRHTDGRTMTGLCSYRCNGSTK